MEEALLLLWDAVGAFGIGLALVAILFALFVIGGWVVQFSKKYFYLSRRMK